MLHQELGILTVIMIFSLLGVPHKNTPEGLQGTLVSRTNTAEP